LIQALGVQAEDIVCISAIPPFSAGHARKIVKDIRESGSDVAIIAGLWGSSASKEPTGGTRLTRLQKSLSGEIASSLCEAVELAKAAASRSTAKISAV
jgi:hypothetical protein